MIIFDWDGTLFDSEGEIYRVARRIFERHNLTLSSEKFRHRPNNGFEWYRTQGVSLSDEELESSFWELFDTSRCGLMEGALSVLGVFQDRGIPCGIVSAHPGNQLLERTLHLDIRRHFDFVIGGASKKSVVLQEVCQKANRHPRHTYFIGDLLSDIEEGKEAGVMTVLLAPEDYPHRHHARFHVTKLLDLLRLI
ncbi:MAG: HAD family hydrolase [Patescibacteria group bacterium]